MRDRHSRCGHNSAERERSMIEYIKKSLGISGNVDAKPIDGTRFVIAIDGDYFGVFDTVRNTFVD